MADYYPLIARAVAALSPNTAERRQAIYSRAREALERQLRGLDPPVSEQDILRERISLEDVIRRVEREASTHREAEAAPNAPAQVAMPDERATEEAPAAPPTALLAGPAAERGRGRPKLSDMAAVERRGRRGRLLLFLLILPIAAVAVIAIMTRDDPARYARLPAVPTVDDAGGKTEDRLGGSEPTAAPSSPLPPPLPSAPVPSASPSDPPVAAAPADRSDSAAPADTAPPPPPVTPPTPPPRTAPAASTVVPVAHRAVMLAEAAGAVQPAQIEGRVIWRLEDLPGENGSPPTKMVHAVLDFPEVMALDLTIKRNLDATLPASHVLELSFAPRGTQEGVRELTPVELRERETVPGATLSGALAPVADNLFLIGLDNSDLGVARNNDLLRTKKWVVFEVRFVSGRRGAFIAEIGSTGEKVIADAYRAWE